MHIIIFMICHTLHRQNSDANMHNYYNYIQYPKGRVLVFILCSLIMNTNITSMKTTVMTLTAGIMTLGLSLMCVLSMYICISMCCIIHAVTSVTLTYMIGASLSEPYTSGTALQDVCVAMSVCLHTYVRTCGHILKL